MFYLVEKLTLQAATPKNLDEFVEFESNQMLPVFHKCDANLMASWICSAESLMQITNVFELKCIESTYKIAAVDIGMPLIAFMRSVTGVHDEIVDIWKGDMQAAGYQTQAYYESIGMSEEWWDWIRDIAPQEKMVKVSVLPYSPLQ